MESICPAVVEPPRPFITSMRFIPFLRILTLFSVALLLPLPKGLASSTKVYFSPRGGCTQAIVKEVGLAQREIKVQAYSFTSASIAKALVDAKRRGVDVTAVLDKTNDKGAKYSTARFLSNAGIPVYIDYKPAIAHSKVMVIDQSTVISGSFNFTKSAEEKNVENLIIFKGQPRLAKQYLANITKRIGESRPYIIH